MPKPSFVPPNDGDGTDADLRPEYQVGRADPEIADASGPNAHREDFSIIRNMERIDPDMSLFELVCCIASPKISHLQRNPA
ncbi:hypothetical protein [Paraburkholderia sediminicola]|uniref:hypothetical protein n=1 Tax=Paraburkholderia sediminicola TaxID=458836 RepID=UPI0038B8F113